MTGAPVLTDARVAVLIVTYKVAALTIDCLRSLASEREANGLSLRAYVVDNASGDAPAILSAINEFGWSGWVRLIESPVNRGYAYGNNLALAFAREEAPPDFAFLLNPDTAVRSGAVSTLLNFFAEHPRAGIVGSALEDRSGNLCPYAFRFPSVWSEIDNGLQFGLVTRLLARKVVLRRMGDTPERVDWLPGASMMIGRPVLEAIGGLDQSYFLYYEETDYFLRAHRAGFETWYVPQARVMHIAGQSTGVTGVKKVPTRLPAYWFESRRRYFLLNHGSAYAIITDVAAMCAHALGAVKRVFLGRRNLGVPNYLADLWRHSTLHPSNRRLAPRLCKCTEGEVCAAKACSKTFAET